MSATAYQRRRREIEKQVSVAGQMDEAVSDGATVSNAERVSRFVANLKASELAEANESLDTMSVSDLRKLAASKEISGRSSMSRDELIAALKE